MLQQRAFDERYLLTDQIHTVLAGMGQAVSAWSCVEGESIGIDTSKANHTFLTGFALRQLAFAMTLAEESLTRDIRKLINVFFSTDKAARREQCLTTGKSLVDIATTRKILQGMSALDLGCGTSPAFARTARVMGAEVFTVDVIGADKFESLVPSLGSEDGRCHIACDLNDKKATKLILAAHANQRFDLVTTSLAQVEYGWNWPPSELAIVPRPVDLQRKYPNGRIPFVCKDARSLARKLLKPGGVFFDASLPQYCQQSKV